MRLQPLMYSPGKQTIKTPFSSESCLNSGRTLFCRSSTYLSPIFSIHQTLILEEEGINGLSSSYDKNLPGFAVVNQTHFVFQLLPSLRRRGDMWHVKLSADFMVWICAHLPVEERHDLMMAMSQHRNKEVSNNESILVNYFKVWSCFMKVIWIPGIWLGKRLNIVGCRI